ncbi:hypothetical protein FE257_002893 [Aspergillus nanangensis]|uniref:Transcription factor domain-containing protein n=1 Tax=Aspergillus nanangensis TaxID=2582783 RepID=A0AAD4CSJ5_ASPNN|nr:hypothetical protein FE257_002893 [Aspergillus nanangensis]
MTALLTVSKAVNVIGEKLNARGDLYAPIVKREDLIVTMKRLPREGPGHVNDSTKNSSWDVSSPDSIPPKPTKRRSTSLKEQIAQLQEKVEDLCRVQISQPLDPEEIPDTRDDEIQMAPLVGSSFSSLNNCLVSENLDCFLDSSTSSRPDPESPSRIFQETDVFSAKSPPSNSIAISSQIGALRRLVCSNKKADLSEDFSQPKIPVRLPEPATLWFRANVFFQEFGCYFPCLREDKVRGRLSAVLASMGYDDYHTEVHVGSTDCQIIAILFNMLAYAEALTQSHTDGDTRPGAQSYCEGLKLMQFFGKLHVNDLETTIYHTQAAALFIEMEMLQMALQSVSQGFHIALCIELNNQKRWPDNEGRDIACRQSLWWTLYFLDKRITQKIGITYSLRENECAVHEFLKPENDLDPQAHHELLQSMISFSQLWAHIWDCFFSPRAPKEEDAWEELQLTDMKIILAYRRLPSRLHWKSHKIAEYLNNSDSERHIRRRLLVFLRFSFLRLSIRHNPIPSAEHDLQRRKSCISLCIAMIEAVRTYTGTFGCHKPSGHILTSALVESLYCVVSELRKEDSVIPHRTLERVKIDAGRILRRLSYTIGAAARAYESLRDVLSSDDNESHLPSHIVDQTQPSEDLSRFLDFSGSADTLGERIWRVAAEPIDFDDNPGNTSRVVNGARETSPLHSADGFESAFSDVVGGFDWDSLIRSLPAGYPTS